MMLFSSFIGKTPRVIALPATTYSNHSIIIVVTIPY